jgi:uncharacterized membrane protein YpjA
MSIPDLISHINNFFLKGTLVLRGKKKIKWLLSLASIFLVCLGLWGFIIKVDIFPLISVSNIVSI